LGRWGTGALFKDVGNLLKHSCGNLCGCFFLLTVIRRSASRRVVAAALGAFVAFPAGQGHLIVVVLYRLSSGHRVVQLGHPAKLLSRGVGNSSFLAAAHAATSCDRS